MYRAALIDLDGTLVDTLGEIAIAANAMLVDAGREPVSDRIISEAIGEGSPMLVERLIGRDEAARWLPVYMDHYRVHNGARARLYGYAREGLDAMRAIGLAIACVTHQPSELVSPRHERLGISSHFAVHSVGSVPVATNHHPGPPAAAAARR